MVENLSDSSRSRDDWLAACSGGPFVQVCAASPGLGQRIGIEERTQIAIGKKPDRFGSCGSGRRGRWGKRYSVGTSPM